VSFVTSQEEIEKIKKMKAIYYNAESLYIWALTSEEIIKKVLPPPLKPWDEPLVLFCVFNYPKTSFGISYRESSLSLAVKYKGEVGSYILSLPVTDDMSMAAGRERYGFPKKIANIHLSKDGQQAVGWTERRGIRFMELQAELTGSVNDDSSYQIINNFVETQPSAFTFLHKKLPRGTSLTESIYLLKHAIPEDYKEFEVGKGTVILKESKVDPWVEIDLVNTIGAIYTIGDKTQQEGIILEEIDPESFAPYAFYYELEPE
jgi:acetoacetate decarboxylase